MHEVRDGNGDEARTLQFDGDLLATSTSYQPGSYRWVEFQLYRTKSGSYILSRIGQTLLFHDPDCSIVHRNNIKTTSADDLTDDHVDCDECHPDGDEVAIEKPRYFALVSDNPSAVIEALYKYDSSGTRYLTMVARRLIENAGKIDTRLDKAYRVEYIY